MEQSQQRESTEYVVDVPSSVIEDLTALAGTIDGRHSHRLPKHEAVRSNPTLEGLLGEWAFAQFTGQEVNRQEAEGKLTPWPPLFRKERGNLRSRHVPPLFGKERGLGGELTD